MTDLERRALLGDQEAQKECTEKGIVLSCPVCGNMAYTRNSGIDKGRGYINSGDYYTDWVVECSYCGYKTSKYSTELLFNRVSGELSVKGKDGRISAIEKWNTRPAAPIGRCWECKEYDTDNCSEGCGWCQIWDIGRFDDGFCDKFKSRGESNEM